MINKNNLCFYMGYSPPFNGKNYGNKNVYGSEISAIKLAETLSDIYNVYIFIFNLSEEDEIIYNNVSYLNVNKLYDFTNIDIMIVVRYINYFIYFKNIAKKTFIWLQDVIPHPAYKGITLSSNGDNLLYNLNKSYDKIIVLSDYQLYNNLNYINLSIDKYSIINNIIDTKYYKSDIPIIKNRFIYTSDISRGLDLLIDCLLFIQNTIPDISLVVFRKDGFTESIITKLKNLNNVIVYGKETQDVVANEFLQAEYFFYPTHFSETFSNSSAEAQLYNTVCIYNNIGSLSATIGDRGLPINYDLNDINYIEKTCGDVIDLMNNTDKKNDFIIRGHQWAKKQNKEYIKYKWLDLFTSI